MIRFASIVLFFLCIICNNSYSQDLIVTVADDSIACKIVVKTKDYIHFYYSKSAHNNVLWEFTTDRVKSVILNYYTVTDSLQTAKKEPVNQVDSLSDANVVMNPSHITEPIGEDVIKKMTAKKWQFGINTGYAYRLFRPKIRSTQSELKYISELKSGYAIGAEAFYFHWEKVGFGLKYDVYKSKAQKDPLTKDNVTIQFLGASVAHRKILQNDKTSIITAFWLGYQPYRNKARAAGQDFKIKAKTMGWGVSIGLAHVISQNLAINIAASCHMGSAYKYKRKMNGVTEMITLSKDNFEDLSRAEFTIGLKYLK